MVCVFLEEDGSRVAGLEVYARLICLRDVMTQRSF